MTRSFDLRILPFLLGFFLIISCTGNKKGGLDSAQEAASIQGNADNAPNSLAKGNGESDDEAGNPGNDGDKPEKPGDQDKEKKDDAAFRIITE